MRWASYASVAVALVLVCLKTWAWSRTDSVSLLSSLADSVLDMLASLITVFAVAYALTPADREHRFGHGKSEGIAGLLQAVIVTASAVYVAVEAILRLLEPAPLRAPAVGVGVMGAALALTLSLVLYQRWVAKRTGSLAIAADATHYQADLATNAAVLAAIGFTALTQWYWVDALVGLGLVIVILLSVASIVRRSLDVLLDRELSLDDRGRINEIARNHPEVRGLHDLRTRSSGAAQFIQFHLELDPQLTLEEAHRISDQVELAVEQAFPQAEVLIHTDPYGVPERRVSFG